MAAVRRCTCALHPPLVAITSGLFPAPVKRHALYRERSGTTACYSHFAYGKAALLRFRLIDRQLQRSMLKGRVGISVLGNQNSGQQFSSRLLAIQILLPLQEKRPFLYLTFFKGIIPGITKRNTLFRIVISRQKGLVRRISAKGTGMGGMPGNLSSLADRDRGTRRDLSLRGMR